MSKRTKKAPGRPEKPPEERKSVVLRVLLTPSQFAAIKEVATLTSLDVSAWARTVLNAAAFHHLRYAETTAQSPGEGHALQRSAPVGAVAAEQKGSEPPGGRPQLSLGTRVDLVAELEELVARQKQQR